MIEDCSPAVQRAVTAAGGWRDRVGGARVDSTHLFLALLEDEDGRAWSLLELHGLPVAQCKTGWQELSATKPASLAEVLTHGRELARRHGQDATVTTDFFLLAIFRTDPALAGQLGARGMRLASLEQEVLGRDDRPLGLPEPIALNDPAELVDAGRVLDAGFNRAREALRVLEDYTRFVLDDALLTRELKSLRHDLAAAAQALPGQLLIGARDTRRDVGTAISTPSERHRHSPAQIAERNLNRLQEALRTLEEFSKLFGPQTAEAIERLRYQSYTLEKAIHAGTQARDRLATCRLYVLLTAAQCEAALDWTLRESAAGGAQMFQLREKDLSDRELLDLARRMRAWAREAGALFIVNDCPDIARLSEADGVHLGQDDMPVKEARRILGPDALIGVSTHSLAQVESAVLDGASYIGVGPTFASQTKHFDELPGLSFVQQAVAHTSLPAFAIGGITLDTLGDVIRAGVKRVAVSAAIARAKDPRLASVAFSEALEKGP